MDDYFRDASVQTATEPRRISNSEASSWLRCRFQYWIAFDLNVEPLKYKEALSKGQLGHKALEVFYKCLQADCPKEQAEQHAIAVLAEAMQSQYMEMSWVTDLRTLLIRYFAKYNDDWEILHVENTFEVPLTDKYLYVMKLDVCVRERSTGHIILVDHKFVYDFWSLEDIDFSPQLPKYFGSLRFNGVPVDKVMVNQLRYRVLKRSMTDDEMFRRQIFVPRDHIVRQHLREQIRASNEIAHYWSLEPEQRKEHLAIRNMNKFNCKPCPVKQLCLAYLHGGNTDLMLQTEYRPNTYNNNPIYETG